MIHLWPICCSWLFRTSILLPPHSNTSTSTCTWTTLDSSFPWLPAPRLYSSLSRHFHHIQTRMHGHPLYHTITYFFSRTNDKTIGTTHHTTTEHPLNPHAGNTTILATHLSRGYTWSNIYLSIHLSQQSFIVINITQTRHILSPTLLSPHVVLAYTHESYCELFAPQNSIIPSSLTTIPLIPDNIASNIPTKTKKLKVL